MLRHDDVGVNAPCAAATSVLQALEEKFVDLERIEEGLPAITAEGEKVRLLGVVKAMETAWHGERVNEVAARRQ
jgi:hypothetical protein